MPELHARLGASSAKRWLACTPSVVLEESLGVEEKTSAYAEEGTLAHFLAEITLKHELGEIPDKNFSNMTKSIAEDSYYNKEMQDSVDMYVSTVIETINELKAKCEDVEVLIEQRLDFSEYVQDGFGTGDVVIIADYTVHVIDLKYGKGISVSALNNPQLRLYGLGALEEFSFLYDINYVNMTIIQPRLDSISTEELRAEDLIAWGEKEVREKAKLAYAGKGDYVCGDHCRFCKAKSVCRKRAEEALKLESFELKQAELLNNTEIGAILARIDLLTSWAKDIKEYALEQARDHGVKFDGWKLVRGRSTRKLDDDEAVIDVLRQADIEEDTIFDKKLKALTKLEKSLGKKTFTDLLSDHVIKPEGAPTLVPESDKRPEIGSASNAAEDFK